jgi:REP element-mobilizing transposase RayT
VPQSLAQIYIHIVFSTKHRESFLLDRTLRDEMHNYLGGTCRNLDSPAVIVGGVADHVHILCHLGKTWSVSDLIRELKRESSKWLKEQSSDLAAFYWQNGYGAFSVSPREVSTVKAYIANQEAHHATETFQDEFRAILNEYQTEYDERYVWD